MSARLHQISFNHDAMDKRASALNLRLDYDEASGGPEWVMGGDGRVFVQPVAYAALAINPARLGIVATFGWSGPAPEGLEIRAVPEPGGPDGLQGNAEALLAAAQSVALLNPALAAYYRAAAALGTAPRLLGWIEPHRVPVGANGESPPVFLRLTGSLLAGSAVGIHEIGWRWQFRTMAGPDWTDFQTTAHRIHVTLETPKAPWLQSPPEAWNTALPWARALERACTWAAGARSEAEICALVCASVHALGRGVIEYGCPVAAREMYANTPLNLFDLTAFLERLDGAIGNGPYVNCTDCACAVSTLANLLGAELSQGRMGEYTPAFMTRDTRVIGSQQWSSPCGWGLGFMFHEVAWTGFCTDHDSIYDASLIVDGDLSWWPHVRVPLLSAGIPFGTIWQQAYRAMLAQPGSIAICHPRPEERRLRAII